MQRSRTYQKSLATPFVYTAVFVFYISLSSIYLFLPPMFGVLFLLFSRAVDEMDSVLISLVVFCLLLFEAEKGYVLFTSIIYFIVLYKFVIPKIQQSLSCVSCVKFLSVVIVYVGFYFFTLLLSSIFMLPIPNITYYIVYYIVVEYFITSIL